MTICAKDRRFNPMLASFVAGDAAFHANLCAGWNGPLVVDFEVSRHCTESTRTNGFAHRLIQQSRNDSAMKITGVSFKLFRNDGGTYNCAIFREQEIQLKTLRICFSAPETSILSSVCQRGEIVEVRSHHDSAASVRTLANTSASTLPPVSTTPMVLPLFRCCSFS